MSTSRRIGLAILGLGVVAGAITLNPLATSPSVLARDAGHENVSGTYEVDGVHSSVIFKIKHQGVCNFYGRINDPAGSFTLGDTASFDVRVPAAKVETGNGKRDDHIRSKDFLSAKEFPDITFSGKDFKKSGENAWKGTGDITFRGVKKPLDVTIVQTGTGAGRGGGELAGIETTFTIKRSDFGNTTPIGPGSDEVTLIVSLEGSAK